LRKAQGGANAAVLIAVIAALILLYIIFLPENEREAILENKSIDKNTGSIGDDDVDVLLREFPGRLDTVKDIGDKTIPNIFLFETTDAEELEKINPFIVRNGWFDKNTKSISFGISDLENTDNVLLSFKAKSYKGILTIKLNNEIIYENNIESETVSPISLQKNLLGKDNTLDFSVSSVGIKFWSTNEYSLEDIKITGDITDKSKQESRNIFTLTSTELFNIDEATLRFVPYCSSESGVGVLDITVNERSIFSAVPVCSDSYRQTIPIGILEAGENKVYFKTSKGSYSVEQIKVEFDEKDVKTNVYYFEVNESTMSKVKKGDKEAVLQIEFVDDDENKRADLNINDRLSTIDQDKNLFTKKLNDYVQEGNNFIEIRPRTRLDIVELRVELQDK
jgi:hypothetical protein